MSPRPTHPRFRLVLVHGTRMTSAQWHGYGASLTEGAGNGSDVEVVAVDLPGHGTRRGREFTWDDALAVIDEAVEGGLTGDRVVLVGHSLGGYLAMSYAARHPDRLAALVLLGSSAIPRGPGAAAYRLFGRWGDRAGADRMVRTVEKVLARVIHDEEFLDVMRDAGFTGSGVSQVWSAVMAQVRPSLLADVSCPVVFVNGQFDQLRVDARRFAAAARRAPWTRVVTIPRASHIFPMTHRRETAAVIAGVLGLLGGMGARESSGTMSRS